MRGIPRLRNYAMHEFLAKITVALMLGTALGCSRQPAQKSPKPGGASAAKNDASASAEGSVPSTQQPAEPGSNGPAEEFDDNEMESPAELVIHHHHYFGLWPPGRLTPSQYDRTNRVIHWPSLLRQKQFSDMRYQLDQLFDQRKPGNSGLKSENYEQIKRQCEAMLGMLAGMIDQLNTEEFVGACGFVKALEDEARFPAE